MTDDAPDRRAELIAAALASELTTDEAAELDALRADDPSIDQDLAEFGVILGGVGSLGSWEEPSVSPALRDRVDGTGDPLDRIGPDGRDGARRPPRYRRLVLAAAAAACVAIGVGGGVLLATPASPPDGPAGALGAVEGVSFEGEPTGVAVDGNVIAHTWGTETVLTIDGLPTGDVYDVVVLDGSGREWSAGTFLGSEVTVSCRMNASILREDAVEVQVRAADGSEIASAALPTVTG